MKKSAPALLLAAACLLGRPAFAETGTETLRQLLAREHIDFQVTRGEDLDKPVSSGDTLDTADTRIIATYVAEGDRLGDRVYVFRLAKPQGIWRAAEVLWPKDSETGCQGGSILKIRSVQGFLYLDGHINPSGPTYRGTPKLSPAGPLSHLEQDRPRCRELLRHTKRASTRN